MDHKPTPEQEEIIRWFRKGTGNLIIEARAGSAKTTTITEGAIQAPEKTVLLCAFNRHSANDLTTKLAVVPTTNRLLHASTLHSAGYKIIQHHWKKIALRENRTEELARKVFERAKVPKRFKLVRAIIDTCSKVKSALPLAETVDDVIMVGEDFDTLAPEKDLPWDLQATLVLSTLELAKQYDGTVGFDDMDWLPVANNWDPPGRYRLVIVDECFVSETPILLANGSCRSIQEIVETGDQVDVMSFDTELGRRVERKVIGGKKVYLTNSTLKINVFYGSVVCTADHQFLTRRGWVAASQLTSDDHIHWGHPDVDVTFRPFVGITSIVECSVDDKFVYDLTVDGTNCYYANGLLAHNCQDTSSTQLMLAKKMVAPPFGRLVFIGDVRQAIYQWRGADRFSFTRIRQDLQHTTLPLTTSFRCSKAVVREAQTLVPDIRSMEGAPEGKVTKIIFPEVALRAKPGDFILSRTNAPLVSVCISLRHQGVKAFIDGKEDLRKLKNVLKKIERTGKDLHSFEHDANAWMQKEVAMARARGSVRRSQQAFDYGMLLGRLAREAHSMREIEEILEDLFHGRKNKNDAGDYMQVICATVHRVKGLESNRVFILRDTLPRYQEKTFYPIDDEEERNIEYVAITRARHELFWVVGLPDNPLGVSASSSSEDEDQ